MSTGTSPYINNSLFISSLLSSLINKIKSMGTYKIGGAPQHNALGFFCGGRTIKIHIEIIERELFT
jgi:hypothetical protein